MKHELKMLYSTREQSESGKRNTALDMVRGIAILLIVIGHGNFVSGVPAVWLSTFHLPVFFLLSGWIAAEKISKQQSIGEVVRHKATSVLVPYVWFSAGSLMLDLIQVARGSFTWDIFLGHLAETVSLQGYSVMWFLPVFFLTQIAVDFQSQFVKKQIRNEAAGHGVSAALWTALALIIYVLYQKVFAPSLPAFWASEIRIVVKAVIGAAFYSYGTLLGCAVKGLFDKSKKIKVWLFVAGICFTAVNVIASFKCTIMDLNNLNVGFLPIYLLLGTTGSLGLILICMMLPNIPVLTFFGQNSLIIMCTHLNFYVMYLAIRVTELFAGMSRPLYVVCVFVITMLLEIMVILIIRMFFPFVLGRARAHREVSKMEKSKN